MSSEIQIILLVCLTTIGLCATVLNGLVITISFVKKLQIYKYFLCNLAIADFLFCFLFTFFQPYFITNTEVKNWCCSLISFISVTCLFTMMTSLPLLAINRYVSLYKSHLYAKLYSRRMTLLYCIAAWLYAACVILIRGRILGPFGRSSDGMVCLGSVGGNLTKGESAAVSFLSLVGVSTVSIGFVVLALCSYKIYRLLKVQQQSLMNLHSAQNLERNKMLLKACVIQGMLPVVCFLPMLLVTVYQLTIQPASRAGLETGYNLAMISVQLNTLLDAVATLYVVVPYRDGVSALLANLKMGKLSFEQDVQASPIVVVPVANQVDVAVIPNDQL